MKLKNDKYKVARGGSSQLLLISCRKCTAVVCHYQKDGPGNLRRMYFDRIIGRDHVDANLVCDNCTEILGVKMIYEKENRAAYRLFVDAVEKRRVSIESIS